jgi:hypothetical protein
MSNHIYDIQLYEHTQLFKLKTDWITCDIHFMILIIIINNDKLFVYHPTCAQTYQSL